MDYCGVDYVFMKSKMLVLWEAAAGYVLAGYCISMRSSKFWLTGAGCVATGAGGPPWIVLTAFPGKPSPAFFVFLDFFSLSLSEEDEESPDDEESSSDDF